MKVIEAMSGLKIELLGQVRELVKMELEFKKLVDQIGKKLIQKYWLYDELVYASEGLQYIPIGRLRQRLMEESHDTQWARHPNRDSPYV